MKTLIPAALDRLQAGERAVLCSILKSSGSAPRGPGARMLVLSDGTTLGTVGGGAVEHQAGVLALELLSSGRSLTREFLLHPNPGEDLGMVCGGDVLLGFYCLRPDREADRAALETVQAALAANRSVWLRTDYPAAGEARLTALDREDLHAEEAQLPQQTTLTEGPEGLTVVEPLQEREPVYIFGGGHVGTALVPVLDALGFAATVYDPRAEVAVPARYPRAERVIHGPFEDISALHLGPEAWVIIMTPGHKADFEVLRQALETEATYIGCIGSAGKIAYVNSRLLAAGFTQKDLNRVHAPIGLPILAETPEEIAVSIAGELILHRHGGQRIPWTKP